MRILIVTPLVPPEPGGPSYYSVALKDALERAGETVDLIAFKEVRQYPVVIRHLMFLYKVLFRALAVDALIILDTVSVAVPAVIAGWALGKKTVVRAGGDFVWESYIGRTHELVLFKDFYSTPRPLSKKERLLVWLQTHIVARLASHVVFNTALQRQVWRDAYGVPESTSSVLENAFPAREEQGKGGAAFICAWRPTAFKNIPMLEHAYEKAKERCPGVSVEFLHNVPREELYTRMRTARAVIIPSLTEFSPNMALEAVSMGVPVVLTRECGERERLEGCVTWIDPLSVEDIADALCALMDERAYEVARTQARSFSYVRTYDEVAQDFLALCR